MNNSLTPFERFDKYFVINSYEGMGLNFTDFDSLYDMCLTALDNPKVISYGPTTKTQDILGHVRVNIQIRSPYQQQINIPDKYLRLDILSWLAITEQLDKAQLLKDKYGANFDISGSNTTSLIIAFQIMRHSGISLLTALPYLNEKLLSQDALKLTKEAFLLNINDKGFEDLGEKKITELLNESYPMIDMPSRRFHASVLSMAIQNNAYKFSEFLIDKLKAKIVYKNSDPIYEKKEGVKSFLGEPKDYSPFWFIKSSGMLRLLSGVPDFNVNHTDGLENLLSSRIRNYKEKNLEEYVAQLYQLGFNFDMKIKNGVGKDIFLVEEEIKNKQPACYTIIKSVLGAMKEKETLSLRLPQVEEKTKPIKI